MRMTPTKPDANRPGRPHDPRIEPAVLDATLALVGERGVGRLTTDAVAARAGVSKASLYKRWASKQALLRGAAAALVERLEVPDTGTFAGDVRALIAGAVALYAREDDVRAIPALVSEMAFDPELATVIREGLVARRREAVTVLLDRARERGELRESVDDELALDLLAGVVYYRFLITGGALDDALVERLADALLHGMADRESGR